MKDGSGKRLLSILETTDRPLATHELALVAGFEDEKCNRIMKYMVRTERATVAGEGRHAVWSRVNKPYPSDLEQARKVEFVPAVEVAREAALEHARAAERTIVPQEIVIGPEPARAALTDDSVRKVLREIPRMKFLAVVEDPRVEASITADGDVLVDDSGIRTRIPSRVAREIFKLARRLEGLCDG